VRKAVNLTTIWAVVTKSGNFNFLEPSGPVKGLLYLYLYPHKKKPLYFEKGYFKIFKLFKNLEFFVYVFSDLSRKPGC